MSAQDYYSRIIILNRRGSPTYAEARRDLTRLNEAIRQRPAA